MSNDFEPAEGTDVDPGEPVTELADLRLEPQAGFTVRLIRRIDTRIFGTQLVDLGAHGLREFFVSYWNMLVSLVGGEDKPSEDRNHE